MTTLDPRALEAAAQAVWGSIDDSAIRGRLYSEDCDHVAATAITAYLAAAQPVVETVQGLIALGDGAVIRDKYGDVSEKRGGLWCGYETAPCDAHRMSKSLPARVIWRPRESP